MSRCEGCHAAKATAEYDVTGVISSMRVALCDSCAAAHGLIETESTEALLARLGH